MILYPLTLGVLVGAAAARTNVCDEHGGSSRRIEPKVMIVNMFDSEADAWYGIPEFNLLEQNITIPGLSPLFPDLHCTKDGSVCQIVTGEGEINAATTIASLVASPLLDLTTTYFHIAGIAGGNPARATLGSVTFARYAVQVALQYEIDPREQGMANFTTPYFPFNDEVAPDTFPGTWYGTEVFEVNDALRKRAIAFARNSSLTDNPTAALYRAKYAGGNNATESVPVYAAAVAPPSVVECDVTTADVWYSGEILSSAFDKYTSVLTNGTGQYCSTAQEDNASLEALMRAAKAGKVDFSRVIVMRAISDFDRPFPGSSPLFNLLFATTGGFPIALENAYRAGVRVVRGIVDNWDAEFAQGIRPTNYVGDVFATLGGTPDFGPGASVAVSARKRDLNPRMRRRALRGW